jgi:tRNA(fMet)-specific endonuclease VapC
VNYMLDTNTCIYLITGNQLAWQQNILARLETLSVRDEVYLSSIVVSELHYGVRKSRWRKANIDLLEEFLLDFQIAAYDESAAQHYGPIRATLEKKGNLIGPLDTLIAAHAVSLEMVLVSHNTREFSRVPGLRLEDWAV